MASDPFALLAARDRTPANIRTLEQWVQHASRDLGATGARTGWILASTLTIAAIQRALGPDHEPLFLLKGGVYLERALGSSSRATKDVDTLFRGAAADVADTLDLALAEPWGPITFGRSEIETIDAPRIEKPLRCDIRLSIKGAIWRRIQIEVAFGDGGIGRQVERVVSPGMHFFGLTTPDDLATIAMDYQVAQKLHACTDPHNPPYQANDRVRDVVDLILIANTFYPIGSDLRSVRTAAEDLFSARAREAVLLGRAPRFWPPIVTSNELWARNYQRPAEQVGLTISLDQALGQLNEWLALIAIA